MEWVYYYSVLVGIPLLFRENVKNSNYGLWNWKGQNRNENEVFTSSTAKSFTKEH
jgi:hypothetical protein